MKKKNFPVMRKNWKPGAPAFAEPTNPDQTGLDATADSALDAGREAPAGGWRTVAADVRNELLQTWQSYKRLAFGHDEMLPVSGGFVARP